MPANTVITAQSAGTRNKKEGRAGMNWTESQRKAIEAQGKTLLVSAGAGSGKTTVLTRRLTERILAGDSIEDFLVVTFTRAAASDLKEKLYNSITDAIAAQPRNRHLFGQLFLLPGARISTIHSFCFDIIKRNFSVLGLSPKMRIGDDTETLIIARECMEELADELYERDDKDFLLLADSFGSEKSDDALIDTILSVYSRLRAFYNYNEWLTEQEKKLAEQAELVKNGFFKTEVGKKLKEHIVFRLKEVKTACESLMLFLAHTANSEKNIVPVEAYKNLTDYYIEAAEKGYNTLRIAASEKESVPKLAKKGMAEEDAEHLDREYKKIKDELKEIKQRFCTLTEEQIYEDYLATLKIINALSKVLTAFDSRYTAAKNKKGILDYSDLEHYLAVLLEAKDENGASVPSELCMKLRRSIKEVYIDEYQDVNPLQDRIFTLLAKPDNRFMVGDLKQSIYRFRNAYPDIFVNYKESFPDYAEDSDGSDARIFLKENFRCSKTVIDFVNLVFAEVTEGNRFAREYKGEELVYAKNSAADAYPVVVALSVLEGSDKQAKAAAAEREAEYIASEIERLVGKQRKEDGNYIKYGDIALLFSAVRGRSKVFERALKRRGIPCMTEQDESLFSMPEIMLTLSALKTIDNPTDDISLCALLRSPIYGFTADELYRIHTKSGGFSLYDSIVYISSFDRKRLRRLQKGRYGYSVKKQNQPSTAVNKCRHFISELDFYRTKAQGMLCYKFLWLFYMRSGLLSMAGSFENGGKCRENLLLLYQYARNFENTGFKGLSAFIMYIGEIAERGGDLANAKSAGQDGDYVHIMSVHKSKGLEFPVCFICDCARQFGKRDSSADLILSRNNGISCRIRDAEKLTKRDTYLRKFASVCDTEAAVDEELRKLYVALTRARERLYVTACVPDGFIEKTYNPVASNSFADWILQAAAKQKAFFDVYIIPEDIKECSYKTIEVSDTAEENDLDPATAERIAKAVSYSYPYNDSVKTPAKLSVSELTFGEEQKAKVNEKMILRRPAFIGKSADYGARKGTANHVFMQFANFDSVEKNGTEAEAKRLLETKMINEEQYELLSYEHLKAFFASDLYREMRASKRLYREKRFSLSENAASLGLPELVNVRDEKVLIQGVIDCFFENSDKTYTLVDYKTDFLPEEGGEQILIERHEKQVRFYCRAVEAMTGKKVTRAVLYSFSLDKSVEIGL
jgi:ATP-dependent helicase/nuclease subunit A